MAFAKAFGVMPSTQEGAKKFADDLPRRRRVRRRRRSTPRARSTSPGFDPVMAAFNSKLATLSKGGDPKAMLAELQKNGDAALKGQLTHPAAGGTRTRSRSGATPPREDDMARRRSGIRGREGIAGWLFTAPMIIILGLFLLVPDRSWRSG